MFLQEDVHDWQERVEWASGYGLHRHGGAPIVSNLTSAQRQL